MNTFQQSCPLSFFQKEDLIHERQISDGGCNASVFLSKIQGKSCIAKLYSYEDEDWDKEQDFLDNFLEICETLYNLKDSPSIVHAIGVVITEKTENIQMYLLTEDKHAQDVYSYIQDYCHWKRSLYRNGEYIPSYDIPYYSYDYNKDICWYYTKDQSEKLQLIRSIVQSIKELHDQDYIHLDIKLHNLVITDNQEVYLIDYDSITNLEKEKSCSLYWRCGTTGYCADEQWECKASKKTDIYSLGVCMAEVWAGEIWLDDSRSKQRYRNQLLSCIRIIEKEQPKLGKLIRKCVSPQEKDRYTIDHVSNIINKDDILN